MTAGVNDPLRAAVPGEREIEGLAARYGYLDDSRIVAVRAGASGRGYYTRGELIEVCAWKTPRGRPRVAANSRHSVITRTGRALAAIDESDRIVPLLERHGVESLPLSHTPRRRQ